MSLLVKAFLSIAIQLNMIGNFMFVILSFDAACYVLITSGKNLTVREQRRRIIVINGDYYCPRSAALTRSVVVTLHSGTIGEELVTTLHTG